MTFAYRWPRDAQRFGVYAVVWIENIAGLSSLSLATSADCFPNMAGAPSVVMAITDHYLLYFLDYSCKSLQSDLIFAYYGLNSVQYVLASGSAL